MGMYKYVQTFWRNRTSPEFKQQMKLRLLEWRRQPVVIRLERPTRIDRARALGYRAKQGFVIIRTNVRRGSRRKPRPVRGRRTKRMGVKKIQPKKSLRLIAEERVARRYPNMEVLNSYWVGQDGRRKWFEVILVDPAHPVVRADPRINWITRKANTRRVFRGLTSAGKHSRGMHNKGKGTEKIRPSLRSNKRRGN